jgi:hypothetical protein
MKKLLPWVVALGILVVVFGTIYTVTQQSQRRDANYPQIQMAEDTAAALNSGSSPARLVSGKVDMGSSLAPFTIIYDRNGNAVSGTGYLEGELNGAPLDMLSAARFKTYNAVTWEPQDSVRIAAVIVATRNYYVLSGRSLTEVEKNESKTFQLSLLGGVVSAGFLAAGFVLSNRSLYTSSVKH